MRKQKKQGKRFWNREYGAHGAPEHLALSDAPSSDMQTFLTWVEKQYNGAIFSAESTVLDLGCGNGRNLIYLAQEYGVQGTGYDISSEGVATAQAQSSGLKLTFEARSIAGDITLPDNSVDLVLDMMTSHFLNKAERAHLIREIMRVLKPGGWLFYKTFLLDEDLNAKALIREHPAEEQGSYIHPKIGVAEHVSTEAEIRASLGEHFTLHKLLRSHQHRDKKGKAHKRRSISVYAELS